MNRTLRTLAGAALLALAGAAVALAGSGTSTPVNAVEGQSFTGTVATFTSTVTPNERFVAQAYLDLLGRSVDPTALAFYDTFLGGGGTRVQVAQAILQSNEYRARLVGSVYSAFLHRSATPTEISAGVSLLSSGATDEELKAFVFGSDEYFLTKGGGTVTGFLTALYDDVLARPIDPATLAALTLQIAGGATRAQIALVVLTSSEARQDLIQSLFQQFLHRSASPAELQQFLTLLGGGSTDEDLIAVIVGSAEYFANVPPSFASATIDWGDGSPSSAGTVIGASAVGGSHTYQDEGLYTFTVTVHDLDGTFLIRGIATVTDAPLSAAPVSFAVPKKTTFTRTVATFSDGNPGAGSSDFAATIDWGDSTVSAGTISVAPGGGFAVSGTHAYKKKGSYSVGVHVADVGGSTADAASTIEVVGKG